MKEDKLTIALVDDHTMFREGLANLLKEYDDIEVLFSVKNGELMKRKLSEGLIPQIVLLDINMPILDGHACLIWLKENHPQVHILALSMYEDDLTIVKMIRNGAGGYILKESNTDEVVKGIRTVISNGYYINELISGRLVYSIREDANKQMNKLTDREIEFLNYCCSELTYKEIAEAMHISPKTVDNYRESLFEKFQIRSRVGLVLYAIKNKLVSLSQEH